MFGYGSPINQFSNKTKAPHKLSTEELKAEVITRIKLDPKIHPDFMTLAEKCLIHTSYVHMVRDTKAVKPWNPSCVTLLGDSVFK